MVIEAVPALLDKLKVIHCMDVAEQSLSALETLSKRHNKNVLHAVSSWVILSRRGVGGFPEWSHKMPRPLEVFADHSFTLSTILLLNCPTYLHINRLGQFYRPHGLLNQVIGPSPFKT